MKKCIMIAAMCCMMALTACVSQDDYDELSKDYSDIKDEVKEIKKERDDLKDRVEELEDDLDDCDRELFEKHITGLEEKVDIEYTCAKDVLLYLQSTGIDTSEGRENTDELYSMTIKGLDAIKEAQLSTSDSTKEFNEKYNTDLAVHDYDGAIEYAEMIYDNWHEPTYEFFEQLGNIK